MRRLYYVPVLAGLLLIGCPSESEPGGGTDSATTTDGDGTTGGGDAGGTDDAATTGTGDDGGTGIPTDATTGDTDVPGDPTCAEYCEDVQAACQGDNQQYASAAECLTYCNSVGGLPIGTRDDTDGNTVGCRIYHAGVAAVSVENAAIHCVHAGATGGDTCGTWCDNYCHLSQYICTGAMAIFNNNDDCQAACAGYADDGAVGATAGNNVQCRMYHLGVAGTNPPSTAEIHCPHAGEDGANQCVDAPPKDPSCADYCTIITANCQGADAQYADADACVAYCETQAALPVGASSDTAGNTVGCRMYHAGVAGMGEPGVHCPHAGPSGGDVCGTWCDNYCHLSGLNCIGDDTLYSDNAECLTGCDAFAADGAPGDTEGDSVQCRIYHLGVAGSEADGSAALHCPHGSADGDGVCAEAIPPSCAAYCDSIGAACTGDNAQYDSGAHCLEYCGTWGAIPLGDAADTGGNTVGCRMYHAGVAAESDGNAAIHCAHAGPSGGDVCGSWCENYCHLSSANCSGGNALYNDDATCAIACVGLTVGPDPLAKEGNSVQCRIYHLGVAGSSPPDSSTGHCAHGNAAGGNDEVGFPCTGVAFETCIPVETGLSCGDTLAAASNGGVGSTQALSGYACQPFDTDNYTAGMEKAWTFTSDSAQSVTISKDGGINSGVDIIVLQDMGLGCVSTEASCLGSGADSVTFNAAADATYYVILDSYNATEVTFDLDVACCVPTCEENGCGDDGCGGSCGGCSEGQFCNAGVCDTSPDPIQDTCMTAGDIGGELPKTVSGNTSFNTDAYGYGAGACPGETSDYGEGAPDQVWSITPANDGIYTFTLSPEFDSTLYVVSDCTSVDTSCLGADDELFVAEEEVSVFLASGATYYVIVDGWGLEEGGAYELTTSYAGLGDTPSCSYYCALVTTACTGDNAQYQTAEECLTYCDTWGQLPLGGVDDVDGNTVGCRIYHAGVALQGGFEVHCPHAGPTGANECGSWCENYCDLAGSNCTGGNALYNDNAACLTACADFPDTAEPGITSGDSVQCKLYHLGVAGSDLAGGSADLHCPHGALDGGGVCVDVSDDGNDCTTPFVVAGLPHVMGGNTGLYDNSSSSGCVDNFAGGGSNDTVTAFTPTEDGTFIASITGDFDSILYVTTDCSGDASACLEHADNAFASGESISWDGTKDTTYYIVVDGWADFTNANGTYTLEVTEDVPELTCEYYCFKVQSACTGDDSLYDTNQACMDYCETWGAIPLGSLDDVAGNSLGCRIYHAGVAQDTSPDVHCAHAGPSGGDVCGTWCENYCALSEQNCTGELKLYPNETDCLAACAAFPDTDAPGITSGPSVQCKIYHLGVAGSNLAGGSDGTHCPHGSETGGGVCVAVEGDTCSNPFVVGALPYDGGGDTSTSTASYSSGCEKTFNGSASGDDVYAYTAGESVTLSVVVDATFDAIVYAVSACDDAAESCLVHADDSVGSGGEALKIAVAKDSTVYVVVDGFSANSNEAGAYSISILALPDTENPELTCDYYCGLVQASCTGDNQQFDDLSTCLSYCSNFGTYPAGTLDDVDGNTLGCRIYHAGVALDSLPDVHCAHAGPSGGDVCGTWCENYCHLAGQNCSGGDALYMDDAGCASACDGFKDTGDAGATGGDTVQCRIYHLGVAGNVDAGGPGTHCAHGGVDGGGVCVDPKGDSCADAITVTALPYSDTGDTTGFASDYSGAGCGPFYDGSGSSDVVYAYAAEANGEVTVKLSQTDFDSALYVLSDCDNEVCLDFDDGVGVGAPESVTFSASQGATYYIVVDGFDFESNVAGAYQLEVELPPVETGLNIEDWTLEQAESTQSFTFPSMPLEEGDYVIVGRDADKADFEAFWGVTLAANVHFVNSGNQLPKINGAETFTLKNDKGDAVDGPTIALTEHDSIQRNTPPGPPGMALSWTIGDDTVGVPTPGSGQTPGAYGIFISEVSDATGFGNFVYEFVELYAAGAPPEQPSGPAFDTVHDILKVSCAPCHTTGSSGGHSIGAADIQAAYGAAQGDSYYSNGNSVGFAALVRIQDYSMPNPDGHCNPDTGTPSAKCLTVEQQAVIQAWLDGGQQPPLP